MINIRRATLDDVNNISVIGKQTFEESYGEFFEDQEYLQTYLKYSFSIDKINNSILKPENLYWIVYDEMKQICIGYAKLKLNSPSKFIDNQNTCKLQRIYLVKGNEGKGIGTRLHEQVLQAIVDEGYEYVWLSNLKKKEAAVVFYKSKGYDVAGEDTFTIGNETFQFWAMKKKL